GTGSITLPTAPLRSRFGIGVTEPPASLVRFVPPEERSRKRLRHRYNSAYQPCGRRHLLTRTALRLLFSIHENAGSSHIPSSITIRVRRNSLETTVSGVGWLPTSHEDEKRFHKYGKWKVRCCRTPRQDENQMAR